MTIVERVSRMLSVIIDEIAGVTYLEQRDHQLQRTTLEYDRTDGGRDQVRRRLSRRWWRRRRDHLGQIFGELPLELVQRRYPGVTPGRLHPASTHCHSELCALNTLAQTITTSCTDH